MTLTLEQEKAANLNNARFLATSRALRTLDLIIEDFRDHKMSEEKHLLKGLLDSKDALHGYRKKLNGWDPEVKS